MIKAMAKEDIPRQGCAKPPSPLRQWCGGAIDEFVASGAEACELIDPPADYQRVAAAMGTELFHRRLGGAVRLMKRGERMFLARR